MGLFDKLKEILFDEEQVEIPVITKEEPKEVKREKKSEDIIVKEIKTAPKPIKEDDDLFDMPRLKEEAKEEVRTSSFTFPVFDDEDEIDLTETRASRTPKVKEEEPKRSLRSPFRSSQTSSVYENIPKEEPKVETKKPFAPSPIISPVYGILNENYKKEDIVAKNEVPSRLSSEKIDLDSVRRKAYGTLEDEIENMLVSEPEVVTKEEVKGAATTEDEDLGDGELSLTDLLMETTEVAPEPKEEKPYVEPEKEEEEEDLFDLIDSLYSGKDED